MALKNLRTREMVKLSGDILLPDSPQRLALDAVPKAAVLIVDLEAAHAGVIAAQPPSKAEIKKLTRLLKQKDHRHDELARCIEDRLLSEMAATRDVSIREQLAEVLAAVLATGRSIVNAAFIEQAGEAAMRAKRVTAPHRALLRKLETIEGVTFEALYDELQQVATEIGALDKRRSDTGAAHGALTKKRDARNQWIKVINGIAAVLQIAGADEGPILGDIRQAATTAGLRVEAADDDEDEDVDDDTDATDTDVLDPPVPTDDPTS